MPQENFDPRNLLGLKADESPQIESNREKVNMVKEHLRKRREEGLILVADDMAIVLDQIKE